VAREKFLQNTITTKRSTQRWHSGLSRGSAKSNSCLLHVVASQRTRVALNPFQAVQRPTWIPGVLLSLYYIPLARNLHTLEPLTLTIWLSQRSTEVRMGWAMQTRHKIRATTRTQVTTWALNTTRQVIYSNGALVAITKNRMRGIGVLVLRNA
jgi:hypothetical protein